MKAKFCIAAIGLLMSTSALADKLVKISCETPEGVHKVSVVDFDKSPCGDYIIEDAKGNVEMGAAMPSFIIGYLANDGTWLDRSAPSKDRAKVCNLIGDVVRCSEDEFGKNPTTLMYDSVSDDYKITKCTVSEKKMTAFDRQKLRWKGKKAKDGYIGNCG